MLDSNNQKVETAHDRHLITSNKEDISQIKDDSLSLCLWKRELLNKELTPYFQSVQEQDWEDLEIELARDDFAIFQELQNILPVVPNRNWHINFAEDLETLARIYFSLMPYNSIRARLNIVDDDKCRLFHEDNLGLRMITTYWGPCTEWLAEADLNRSGLGKGSNELVQKKGTPIRSFSNFDVGLLKGKTFSGHSSKGCVHRSPQLSGTGFRYRVVFTIDNLQCDS